MNGMAALLVLVNDNFTMLHLSRAKAASAGCKSTAHLKVQLALVSYVTLAVTLNSRI